MLKVSIHTEYSTNCIRTEVVSKRKYSNVDSRKTSEDTTSANNLDASRCRSPTSSTNMPPSMGAQINKLSSGRD